MTQSQGLAVAAQAGGLRQRHRIPVGTPAFADECRRRLSAARVQRSARLMHFSPD
jgi:hypothetical protein